MAQSRTHKIGTIYSRVTRLLQTGAMKEETKPLWYAIYEAFPPKYEPRIDRHTLTYGNGGNVAKMPPPPKILYEEDILRAKYYKVLMPPPATVPNQPQHLAFKNTVASSEVFDLFEKGPDKKKTLSQKFIEKYDEVAAQNTNSAKDEKDLFVSTIDALELDGVHLLKPIEAAHGSQPGRFDRARSRTWRRGGEPSSDFDDESGSSGIETPPLEKPSMRELFEAETESDQSKK